MTALNVVVAAAGVLAAFLTWRATAAVTRIERHRWHADLTPAFDAFVEDNRLVLIFTGPVGLDSLDDVTVRIRDEGGVDRLGQMIAGTATPNEIVAHIWAPRRFDIAAQDQALDDSGREARAHLIHEIGSWHRLLMSPSRPPQWSAPTPQDMPQAVTRWNEDYADKPLRLLVVCRRDGHDPWYVPVDVAPPPNGWAMPPWP